MKVAYWIGKVGQEIKICTWILHTGYTSRMRNNDSTLCLWAHDIWGGISRKPLEIETWVQRTTNRKWPIPSSMVTWPMTSCDPERSKSWPQYVSRGLSRKRLEIGAWLQWTTTWPWKVKVTTPMCLGLSISKMAGDRDFVTMDHL